MSHVNLTDLNWIVNGDIPSGLDELANSAQQLIAVNKRTTPLLAMIVAKARRLFFATDVAGWVSWCEDQAQLVGSYLHHMRKIGDLLLDVAAMDRPKEYNLLLNLDATKLLPIARIEAAQIPAFLSHHSVQTLSRTQVRVAVAQWLGDEVPEQSVQLKLPGFEEAIEGINYLIENNFDFEIAVSDNSQAQKSFYSGMGLVAAAMSFHKKKAVPDVEELQEAKKIFLEEINEIEEAIARACPDNHEEQKCSMLHQAAPGNS